MPSAPTTSSRSAWRCTITYSNVGSFPPGSLAGGTNSPGGEWSGPWWPWAAYILPEMELTPLYNSINFSAHGLMTWDNNSGGDTSPENSTVYLTIINTYQCPSDDTLKHVHQPELGVDHPDRQRGEQLHRGRDLLRRQLGRHAGRQPRSSTSTPAIP